MELEGTRTNGYDCQDSRPPLTVPKPLESVAAGTCHPILFYRDRMEAAGSDRL